MKHYDKLQFGNNVIVGITTMIVASTRAWAKGRSVSVYPTANWKRGAVFFQY
jgi:hypothetical protein